MNEEGIETNIYCRNGEVVFSITEHHKWGENDREHLAAIVKVIKEYIATFISGKIYSDYPEAKSKRRIIEVVGEYPPNTEAKRIFELLGKSSGFSYRFKEKRGP
jgi:hypothetical protein